MTLNKSFRGIPGVAHAQDADAGHEAGDLIPTPAPGDDLNLPPQGAAVPQGAGLDGGGDVASLATQDFGADAAGPPTDLISAAASLIEHPSSPPPIGAPSRHSFEDSTTVTLVPSTAPSGLPTLHEPDVDGVALGPPRRRRAIATLFLSAARTVGRALRVFQPAKKVNAKRADNSPALDKH